MKGQVNAGLSVPLNLSKGRSLVNLTMGSDYVFKKSLTIPAFTKTVLQIPAVTLGM